MFLGVVPDARKRVGLRAELRRRGINARGWGDRQRCSGDARDREAIDEVPRADRAA